MREVIGIEVSAADRERIGSGGGGWEQSAEARLAGADYFGDREGCGAAEILRRAGVSKALCGAGKSGLCAKGRLACCARRPESLVCHRCRRRWSTWSR